MKDMSKKKKKLPNPSQNGEFSLIPIEISFGPMASKTPGGDFKPLSPVELVDKVSQDFERNYKQPKETIAKIILKSADHSIAEMIKLNSRPYDKGIKFPKQVPEMLKYIPAKKILNIIDGMGRNHFRNLCNMLDYLSSPFTPLYSLDELLNVLTSFQEHLLKTRDLIEKTGYPGKCFERSPWINSFLNRLYFTKSCEIKPFKRGLQYTWIRLETHGKIKQNQRKKLNGVTTKGAMRASSEKVTYELADYLHPFKSLGRDTEDLEDHRPQINATKLAILKILIDAMNNKSYSSLWFKCNKTLFRFDKERVKFLIEMDRYYDNSHLNVFRQLEFSNKYHGSPKWQYKFLKEHPEYIDETSSGGVGDILEIIGHIEQELKYKTHHFMNEQFREFIIPSILYGANFDIGRFLKSTISRRRNYLEKLLNNYIKCFKRHERFWQAYTRRIEAVLKKEYPDYSIHWAGRHLTFGPRISLQRRLFIYKDSRIIKVDGQYYQFAPNQFKAICYMIDMQKQGQLTVSNRLIYEHVFGDKKPHPKWSVRTWCRHSRGGQKDFAETFMSPQNPRGRSHIDLSSDEM
jgi:hypothetical protein